MTTVNTNFKNYLAHIANYGHVKTDRTGTGTISVFGYQMRFDLAEGFPLETLKFTAFRLIKEELLWFIRGDTNAQNLINVNCHIWDEWMVKEDIYEEVTLDNGERAALFAKAHDMTLEEARQFLGPDIEKGHRRMDESEIPRTKSVLRVKKGELGPVYGRQWRSWPSHRGGTIDQLQWAIDRLKTNPDCRRIIVSAWNPADLPLNGVSPHDNAAQGYMALAACHTMFQFMTAPLTASERALLLYDRMTVGVGDVELKRAEEIFGDLETRGKLISAAHGFKITRRLESATGDLQEIVDQLHQMFDTPKYRLSCQLYQRSADSTLGVPFNIASYALLTHMVAQCVNMVPGDFVHTFGDAHIYLNHFEEGSVFLPESYTGPRTKKGEGVDTLLTREVLPFPKLVLNPAITNIDDFTADDIQIEGYKHSGKMAFPVAV